MNSFFEMANALADRWLDGMWPVIWQSAALAGIIYLLTLCLRRASAAVCFWLWMLVPLRLLVMPLITISLPLLPAATPLDSADIPIESMPATAMVAPPMADILPESAPMTHEPPRVSLTTAKLAAASHRVWPSAWTFLMAGWLAGVAFWSVRLLRSWRGIRRIARHAAQVSDDTILAVAKRAAAMLGLGRVPRILVTEEKVSPFLFGIFRSVLVIPARLVGTVHDEQLRAVFAHEFAHVRRRDPLIGWVLAVCEAVYFFHPVFHFVKRRILFERERACDGWVIAAGKTGRSIYAHALINAADVCRSFRTKVGPVGAVAESFADLKKRLMALASNFKPRTRLSLSALILLFIIGAICVPGIVLTARSEGESERTDAQVGTAGLLTDDKQKAAKFIATLPNGVTVELIGVCEHPSEGKQWWLPDGSVLPQKPYGTIKGDRAYFGADEKAYEFVVRLAGPADVDVKWKAVPDGGSRMTSFPHGSDGRLLPDLRVLITKFHKRTAWTLLRIGVAPKVPDKGVIQDYQWVQFKNVSLRPGFKTDVQVEIEKADVQVEGEVEKTSIRDEGKSIGKEHDVKVVRGLVRDRQGRPIPHARVVLYYKRSGWGLGNHIAEETHSAADGSFTFEKPLAYAPTTAYPHGRDSYILLATHPDHALHWHKITRGQEQPGYELILTEPKSQTITVTDHDGNPIAGARVWPYHIGSRTASDPLFRDYLSLPTDPGVAGAATDAHGRATVTNLPNTSCSFHADLKGYAQGLSFSGSKPIRLSKGASVSGTVLDEQGKPVEGAIVRFKTDWNMWQFFLARTDSQGRFRLEDLPAEGWDMSPWGKSESGDGSYRITVEHSDYVSPETQDQLQPGEVIDDFTIDACRGTLVTCNVVEVDTNRPVVDARISGSNESGRIDGRSDANGVFTVRVMSGPTSLFFNSPPDGVYVLRGENPPESSLRFEAEGTDMIVTLKSPPIAGRLATVRGKVQLPDGTPATDVKISTTNSASYESSTFGGTGGAYTATNADGSFELKDVPAGLKLFLYGHTKDHQYILTEVIDSVTEPTELSSPLIMRRGQVANILLTDEQGQPRANMSLKVKPVMWGNQIFRAEYNHGQTNAEGRLEINGIIPGMEYFVIESSANLGQSGWWDKYYNETIVLIPSSEGVSSSEVVEPAAPQPKETGRSSSRAWYILRQWNVGPLLLGLPQRLGKAIKSTPRDDYVWTGVDDGGRLELDIAIEGDVTGEIFIGFFKDATWSAKPVQVRSFPRPGRYTIGNLPPGKFQIGAMIGELPVADALGVRRTWPEPVEIRAGVTTEAEVLVSEDFQKHASGWHNENVSREFLGDWERLDGENLLQGRVTGPGGRPVSFAEVQVREYDPGARSISAPDCGTSEQGFYKCDRIAWPYRVGVLRREPIPSALGYRHQYLYYNRVFEGSQTVDFKFDSFPKGNAKLNGRVIDQNGEPLGGFHIDVSTKINWQGIKNPDGKFYRSAGYRIPFTSDDGTFELGGLPEGDVRVHVIPFQIQAYSYHRSEEIVLSAGKTSTIELRVTAKNVLFGRVLFKDGSPAVIKPPRWKSAKTRVHVNYEGMDWANAVVTVDDDGYFAVYLSEAEIEQLKSGTGRLVVNVPTAEERSHKTVGKFPFERLSRDKSKAGVLQIEHPLGEPPSLADTPLPKFEGIEIEFRPEQAKGKKLLVCFWDMNQRPSRNLVGKLAEREKELEDKGVVVLLVHTSDVETTKLKEWVNNRKIPFACGNIKDDAEMVLFRWGVRALPWLVLMDEKGVVRAEGFTLEFLDAVLEGKVSAEQMAPEKGAGSDKVVLKLTDSDGWPVAGAQVGTNVRTRDVSTLGRKLSFSVRGGEHNISSDWGEIVLTREKLFLPSWPADVKTLLYVLHEDRNIGAVCEISRDDPRREIRLTLEPVCHVHGNLDSKGLKKVGRPLTWSNVYLSWNRDSFGVLSHMSEEQRFEFFVPPGKYELDAYGSGEGASTESVHPKIEVEAGQSELDLGIIDLPATKVTSLIGQPAPEWGAIKAWKNGSPVKLADLRGKLVILHFGGGYPSTSRDLPRLVEVHEQFQDAGLVIIAIYNCESMEQLTKRFAENSERFGGERDVPFRLGVDGGKGRPIEGTDRTIPGATYAAYDISVYPTTVLIGRQGQIIEKLSLSRAKEKLESMLGVTVEPTLSGWRQQFYQVYRLEEGQVLKRIAPPFIPQRKDYHKQEHSHQAELIERPPDYFTFHWDGELKNWGLGFGSGKRPLSSVLNSNLSITRDKFEGPEELLKIDVPGDWIVRKDVSEEEKLKALEQILADEMGRNIRFIKRTVEREAIVATGRFQYRRLPVAQDDRYVHMFSGDFDLESGGGGGTADSVSQFLQALGNRVRMPVIDETEPSQQVRIPYRHHRSAYLGRIENPAEKREKLTQLLDNLSRQTDLRFTVEPRPVEIWFVTEDKTDK